MSVSLFCDKITVVDIAFYDQTKGLVGASYHASVEFIGKPDDEGILIDFSHAKKKVKAIIDDICDHRFIVPKGLVDLSSENFQLEYRFGPKDETVFYSGPVQAICEIPFGYVSKAHIASFLETQLNDHFGDSFDQVKLELDDETLAASKPVLSYTHGLKHHYGNCQRLFHGHNNSIDIWVNDEPRPDLESWVVRDCLKTNIHFCVEENIKNLDEVKQHLGTEGFGVPEGLASVEIEYSSSQGEFKCSLPGSMVYVIPEESTIENLSSHLAGLVKDKIGRAGNVKLKAYEGIAKGAISYC